MKKLTSLILAVVSTMLLVTGATQAAEKLDPLGRDLMPAVSEAHAPQLGIPCQVGDPE